MEHEIILKSQLPPLDMKRARMEIRIIQKGLDIYRPERLSLKQWIEWRKTKSLLKD